jgi:uncharacterized protein (TIGR02246 family)
LFSHRAPLKLGIQSMIRINLATALWIAVTWIAGTQSGLAQPGNQTAASAEQESIRLQLADYVKVFNQRDAVAVAKFWSPDCLSIAEDSGHRIEGREAIQQHFADFFQQSPSAQLEGEVTNIQMIRPDIAAVEGRTVLLLADGEPVESVFSSTLVKEGDNWLITNSRERDLLPVTSPQEALQDLEWMIGQWEDQADYGRVVATIRWTPNRAFLIRSFAAIFDDQEQQGTQVIGWDPRNRQIRTWIFHSDGSFGQGTISKHDDAWIFKMSQTLSDGRIASGTQVVTGVDENTITVQTIGETVDGELLPSGDPVTVVRIVDVSGSSTDGAVTEEGVKP